MARQVTTAFAGLPACEECRSNRASFQYATVCNKVGTPTRSSISSSFALGLGTRRQLFRLHALSWLDHPSETILDLFASAFGLGFRCNRQEQVKALYLYSRTTPLSETVSYKLGSLKDHFQHAVFELRFQQKTWQIHTSCLLEQSTFSILIPQRVSNVPFRKAAAGDYPTLAPIRAPSVDLRVGVSPPPPGFS